MTSIHRSSENRLALAASAVAIASAATLIVKRIRWNSQRSERTAYQESVSRSLVGPNPKMVSVEKSQEDSSLSMLTSHHVGSSQSTASITAVIVHGFGCTSLEFHAVVEQLQQREGVSIFRYDRVLFTDDYDGKSRDAPTLARELRALLQNANVSPPYLLIGHSYGGLVAQQFASFYTKETQGMVLIDPAHELQRQTFPKDFAAQFALVVPVVFQVYEKLAWTGLLQFLDRLGLFNFPPIFLMAAPERAACARLYSHGGVWNKVAAELIGCNQTFDRLATMMIHGEGDVMRRPIQALPTCLVIAGHRRYSPTLFPQAVTQAFLELHRVSLPRAKVLMAERSDHWVHLQEPQIVLEAVDHVLDEWKKEQ